ncbi:MAG TPA: DUF4886 domain-containing protein [Flavobacteriales bacterium]
MMTPLWLVLSAQTRSALFIGNSYVTTNDLPEMVRLVALSLGDTLEVMAVAPGGYTFQQHASLPATQQAIAQQGWDFVVLQEQSQIPAFTPELVEENCYPFAQRLVEQVRANDSCTAPVFYMTWGRENGDAGNCAAWPPVCTYAGMQELLRERYLFMAQTNNAACAPVGAVWQQVRAMYPGIDLYIADGSHPTEAGTYLAACTFYASLFRRSPVEAWFPVSLGATVGAQLQSMAADVVLDSLPTWNIGTSDPDAAFTWSDEGEGVVQFQAGSVVGQHAWFFGTEGGSDAIAPVHVFGSVGPHTVLHTLTDACGRMDSSWVEVTVIGTGISNVTEASAYEVASSAEGALLVQGGGRGERLWLYDQLGRELRSSVLVNDALRLSGGDHAHLWRIIAPDGSVHTGRVKRSVLR